MKEERKREEIPEEEREYIEYADIRISKVFWFFIGLILVCIGKILAKQLSFPFLLSVAGAYCLYNIFTKRHDDNVFVPAISILTGQFIFYLTFMIITFPKNYLMTADLLIMFIVIIWLYVKPGKGIFIFTISYQILSMIVEYINILSIKFENASISNYFSTLLRIVCIIALIINYKKHKEALQTINTKKKE